MMSGNSTDIAIVGMAGRFPGARNIDEFWRNLAGGVESIARLSDDEMLAAGVPPAHLSNPRYVKAAPVLDAPEEFDAAFFGFAPAEAESMDPQHRLLLELSYEALEHAGCDTTRYSGRVGVFAGSALNTYYSSARLHDRIAEEYIPTLIGNDKDFLATRVSYALNLTGPSLTVQTACSTSLVAVHLARQSLLSGESDMALAGAVAVRVPHRAGYFCDGGGLVSPDGHVRAFDAGANGTVFGSGGGVLVLKRLADAIADGDAIHAVIKGSAVNNDGASKAGYTAPSVQCQADVVVEALANAGVDASTITYLEAHGSGTPVGDPIELAALTRAFRAFTSRSGFCAIGSVKTNVGHLDAAAGAAGMIKTVLALSKRAIPATLNHANPNREIDFPQTPFFVNTTLREWQSTQPRRAGVMATGMGGTNAHVVLEEALGAGARSDGIGPHVLVVSAKSDRALDAATTRLAEHLANNDVSMDDVAHTLQDGRRYLPCRRAVVCSGRQDAVRALAPEARRLISGNARDARRPVVLLVPGVGDHYVDMGRELYERWPAFTRATDECARVLEPHVGLDIRPVLYPAHRARPVRDASSRVDLRRMLARDAAPPDPDDERLSETRYAQPALFAVEYALCELWRSLGVTPDAIVGHSMGEYVAATLAGVMSLEDALRLIAVRARMANALPRGAMLAVTLSEPELRPLLPEALSVALVNGPNLCVVAGAPGEVAEFEATLTARHVICRPLRNGHAFHSRMLAPMVEPLEREIARVTLNAPRIPFISNVTGTWITERQATSPAYWASHAALTSRFSDGLQAMWRHADAALIEAGPGRTLGVLAMQHPARREAGDPVVLASLRHDYDHAPDAGVIATAIAGAWVAGVDINWRAMPSENPRKVPLPSYPFERTRHWRAPSPATGAGASKVEGATTPPTKSANLDEWLYVPSWKRLPLPPADGGDLAAVARRHVWLVFADELGICSRVTARLREAGARVITVTAGTGFAAVGQHAFTIDPRNAGDYVRLLEALHSAGIVPERIVHAWSVAGDVASRADDQRFENAQDGGFHSVVALARALALRNVTTDVEIAVLCSAVCDVTGAEPLGPERSTVIGPCLVIHQEYPNVRVRCIDIETSGVAASVAAGLVTAELFDSGTRVLTAYRHALRWVQTYEPVRSTRTGGRAFRDRGVYMITGGRGRIAAAIAEHLAERYHARLVLVGRARVADERVLTRISQRGGEAVYVEADVADPSAMRSAVNFARRRYGALHGVIHAAGVVGDKGYGEIEHGTRAVADAHFRAKAAGVRSVETAVEGQPLDFVLLMSSLASILGGLGQSAYAASNIYMDAFALAKNRRAGPSVPWISVNWDVWRLDSGDSGLAGGVGATLSGLGMTRAEAMAMLEYVVAARPVQQLIVSTGALDARLAQWVNIEPAGASASRSSAPVSTAVKTAVGELADPPRDDTERRIAGIWQDVLGVSAVGVHDRFAKLGGHSLLAVKVVAALRKAFHIDLPVRALFDTPTIAELAESIRARVTAEIESLSDDEVRAMVSSV